MHANHLERANISDWPKPAPRKINDRAAKYVVPPVVSTETEQDSEQTELYTPPVASDSGDNLPLAKLRQRLRDADSYSDTAEMVSDMRSENMVSAIWIEQKKIAKGRDTYTIYETSVNKSVIWNKVRSKRLGFDNFHETKLSIR